MPGLNNCTFTCCILFCLSELHAAWLVSLSINVLVLWLFMPHALDRMVVGKHQPGGNQDVPFHVAPPIAVLAAHGAMHDM